MTEPSGSSAPSSTVATSTSTLPVTGTVTVRDPVSPEAAKSPLWPMVSVTSSGAAGTGLKLCFAGTATPGVDYSLDTHFREEAGIAIGADGCTAQRIIPGGDDRYHFYISHFDDPHAEGTETIVVTVTGLNNVFFSDQPGINIIRFTIVDDETPAAPKPQQGEQDAQPADIETPSCVSDALLADVDDRIRNAGSPAGVERWTQVKNALTGQANAIALAEVQTIYDRRTQNGWSTSQWDPVIEAMECLAAAPEEQPEQAEVQPATPATPELSLRAGVRRGRGRQCHLHRHGRPGAGHRPDDCLDRRPERRVSGRPRRGQPDGGAQGRHDQRRALGGHGGRRGGRGRRFGERHPRHGHGLYRGHGQGQHRGDGARQ